MEINCKNHREVNLWESNDESYDETYLEKNRLLFISILK